MNDTRRKLSLLLQVAIGLLLAVVVFAVVLLSASLRQEHATPDGVYGRSDFPKMGDQLLFRG
jgi:hypothetical protein